MEVVGSDDAGQTFNILLDVIDAHALGRGLKKNARRSLAKRDGRGQDDDSDEQRDAGIDVETPLVVSQPDDQCRSNDTDVAERIAHDVQEDTAHIQVMAVAVATLLTLRLCLSMVMALVNIFLCRVIRDRERNPILISVVGSTVTVAQKTGSFGWYFILAAVGVGRLLGVETATAGGNNILSQGSRVHVYVLDIRKRGAITARAAALRVGRPALAGRGDEGSVESPFGPVSCPEAP